MSFFQTLLNANKPFKIEKNQPDDYRTSLIYSAYNSCYPIVDNTKDASTQFRKKVATEAMLFLLAYGITYVVQRKNYGEFEYKGFVWGVSKLLSETLLNEVKNYGVDEEFIQNRIFNYAQLLSEIDNESGTMIHVSVIMNEKPLNHLIHDVSDFPKVSIDSKLGRDLGEILLLSPFPIQALELMKQAMIRSYGLK